jgi:LPS-assembly protein
MNGVGHGQEPASSRTDRSKPPQETFVLPTDIPVHMSTEKLSFNHETNTFSAAGNVTLSQGNTRVRADSIRYEANTGELTATGKVIIRMGSDVVEAEKISVTLPAATGVMVNGKLFLTRHNVYLEGKKLEKTGDSTYKIREGSFTTCDGARPDWRITGKDLDVTLEGYGTLKHGFFYVKDIPVFYIPWLIYPAKRTRQTGFLMPSVANSSIRGFDMRLPFFLSISPSIDATVVPRICTRRAFQTALEFRYFPYEDLHGRFYGEYTYDWMYGPERNPKSHRVYLTFLHDQELAGQVRFKVNGSWVSDRDYFEFWGGRFDRRLRVRYLESNAIVYKQTNNLLFQTEAKHFDNLDLANNAPTVQNLPIITGTLFNRDIPYTPFYLSSNVVFNHFYAPVMHHQWLGSRIQWDTRLSLPLALGRYLKMEPSMTYFAKGYSADYYERDKSISSVTTLRTDLYQVNADLFTDLNAVFNGPFLGFQKVKHTIRPRVGWTFRPFRSQQTYPYFDDADRMDRISLLTAEMRQTFTGRLGPGEYLDFITFSVWQGFDFLNTRDPNDSLAGRYPLRYNWTNTRAELTLKPHSLVDLSGQAQYDPVVNRARSYSFNLGLMDHRGDLLRVLHQFTEDERREDLNRQTNVNLQVKLLSTLDCFFENQYTHQFNFSYFTSVGLNFHPQCWNLVLQYSEAREQDPITRKIKEADQTVFVTLSLYGLGQVYRLTRDWSEIFGLATETVHPTAR